MKLNNKAAKNLRRSRATSRGLPKKGKSSMLSAPESEGGDGHGIHVDVYSFPLILPWSILLLSIHTNSLRQGIGLVSARAYVWLKRLILRKPLRRPLATPRSRARIAQCAKRTSHFTPDSTLLLFLMHTCNVFMFGSQHVILVYIVLEQ